jgi:hypothetical protein
VYGVQDYLYPSVYNSGVLVFTKKATELVKDWENLTLTKLFRSDQEALQIIREQNPEKFQELPMSYNHQKWAIKDGVEPNSYTRILHWTGADGKIYLRNKLAFNTTNII